MVSYNVGDPCRYSAPRKLEGASVGFLSLPQVFTESGMVLLCLVIVVLEVVELQDYIWSPRMQWLQG